MAATPRRRAVASIIRPPASRSAPARATMRVVFSPVKASGPLLNDSPSTLVGMLVVVTTAAVSGPVVGVVTSGTVDVVGSTVVDVVLVVLVVAVVVVVSGANDVGGAVVG